MPPHDQGARSLIDAAEAADRLLTGAIWAELRTFLAVARLGSANRAADALGISHTSVGRQLRRLHDVLQDQLVVLTRRGAFLTPKGERLAAALTEVDLLLWNTIASDSGRDRVIKGNVRVRVTEGVCFTFVIPALPRLTAEHPGISVSLGQPQPYERLRENTADIIVAFGDGAPSDMTIRRLGYVHMVPFASRDYVKRFGSDLADSSADHRFIDSARYSGPGTLWAPWRDIVRRGTVVHTSEMSIPYATMIKAGLGVGLMPAHNVCEPDLVPFTACQPIRLDLQTVCLTERLASPAVRVVFDFLSDILSPERPWLTPTFSFDDRPATAPEGYARMLNLPE